MKTEFLLPLALAAASACARPAVAEDPAPPTVLLSRCDAPLTKLEAQRLFC